MSAITKTLVATGASSGIGFEVIKQLLAQTQSWNLILGVRDTAAAQTAFDALKFDANKHKLTVLPLELSHVKNVKPFAEQILEKVGADRIDYVLLNAGLIKNPSAGFHPKYSEMQIVNHLSQHYLLHLLRAKVVESKSRIVFVSSGALRSVKDTSTLGDIVKDKDGKMENLHGLYSATKFIQLLGALWWSRELKDSCEIVAVSPGLVPGTGLARHTDHKLDPSMPDAISIPQSGQNILRAFTKDLPEDEEQIVLASWGEWWPKDDYKPSLDKSLQNKWSPGKEEIEQSETIGK